MKSQTIKGQIGAKVSGMVQCKVVDAATGEVVRTYPKQSNLILNQGLDQWMSGTYSGFAQLFAFACAGTGTTDTKVDSGAVTASQAGTTVTLSGGSFFSLTATDVGKMIKWDSGEEAMVITVTSATEVTVDRSQSVSSGEFTIYFTNQTKMGGGIGAGNGTSDVKRTNTYVTGSGDCGTTWSSPHISELKRTYDFSAEVGSVTYTEIGASYNSNVNTPTLFMRVLLDTPVSLTAGQILRFVYTLTITWSPSASFNASFPVTNWPVAPATDTLATMGFEYLHICDVLVAGGSGAGDRIDPGQVESIKLYSVQYLPPATPVQTYTSRQSNVIDSVGPTYSTYVANSFTRTMTATFSPAEGNSTSIRTVIVGYSDSVTGNYRALWMAAFDQAQTKDSLHRLVFNFTYTCGRVLA